MLASPAAVIIELGGKGPKGPGPEPEGDDYGEAYEKVGEEMIKAIKDDDAKKFSMYLKDFIEVCSSGSM